MGEDQSCKPWSSRLCFSSWLLCALRDVGRAFPDLFQQRLGVVDQLSRCNVVKYIIFEGRSVEHCSHLNRYGVALRSKSGDFILKRRILRVVSRIAACKRGGRNLQTGKSQAPKRRVDLLINMGELRQSVLVVSQPLRNCVIVDRLRKYPAVVDVSIL